MNQLFRHLVSHAEAVLFVGVFAEQMGVPLPAIPMLLAAGALVADGTLNPIVAVGITVVASVLADWIWFLLGRRGGGRLLQFICKLSRCDGARFAKAERTFAERGTSVVIMAKFFPWLGFLVPPLAGAFGYRTGRFLQFDALGSFLYGMVYLGLGYLFGREIDRVLDLLSHFGPGIIASIGLLALAFAGRKYAHRRKATAVAPAPLSVRLVAASRN